MPLSKLEQAASKLVRDFKASALKDVPEDKNLSAVERQICPICCRKFPFDRDKCVYDYFCGNRVCMGCVFEATNTLNWRDSDNYLLKAPCFFCRHPGSKTNSDLHRQMLIQAEQHNDHNAMYAVALEYYYGSGPDGEVDHEQARIWFERAANAGSLDAANCMVFLYVGVDDEVGRNYLEMSAKGGSLWARSSIAICAWKNENIKLAASHAMVSACEGDNDGLSMIKRFYMDHPDIVTKELFEAALRAHHDANVERNRIDFTV